MYMYKMSDNKEDLRFDCPECGKIRYYTDKSNLIRTKKENKICKSCSNKGKNNRFFGKVGEKGCLRKISHTEESKQKTSKSQINRCLDNEEKMRTSILVKEVIHKPEIRKKHLNVLHHSKRIKVRTDKGQLELIEKWNKLGFNFQPNYQIKPDVEILKPKKFWRYDSVNKQFKNILERK